MKAALAYDRHELEIEIPDATTVYCSSYPEPDTGASDEVKRAISNYITHHDSFKPFTTGNDLKKMGVREGPVFKEVLDHLKDAKIDLDLRTKEEEVHFLQSYLFQKGILP